MPFGGSDCMSSTEVLAVYCSFLFKQWHGVSPRQTETDPGGGLLSSLYPYSTQLSDANFNTRANYCDIVICSLGRLRTENLLFAPF